MDKVEATLLELIKHPDARTKVNAAAILCELGTIWGAKEDQFYSEIQALSSLIDIHF